MRGVEGGARRDVREVGREELVQAVLGGAGAVDVAAEGADAAGAVEAGGEGGGAGVGVAGGAGEVEG